MNTRKAVARVAGAGLAAAAAVGYFSVGAANADSFIPLPGGAITQTLSDGTVVTVSLDGESANINPSMGATPLHRNVWTSGHASVDLSGGNADNATIKIYPGYIVGCQVDLEGGSIGGGAETAITTTPNSVGASTSLSPANGALTLGPGQAKAHYILDRESADDYGSESHTSGNKVQGPHAGVTWTDETMAVNGCAGYAQARAFVTARIYTDNGASAVTLWGKPFSLG